MRSKKNKFKKSFRRSYKDKSRTKKTRISKRSKRSKRVKISKRSKIYKRVKRSKRVKRVKRSKRIRRNIMKGGSKSDQRVDEWFYNDTEGTEHGPYKMETILAWFSGGQIHGDSIIFAKQGESRVSYSVKEAVRADEAEKEAEAEEAAAEEAADKEAAAKEAAEKEAAAKEAAKEAAAKEATAKDRRMKKMRDKFENLAAKVRESDEAETGAGEATGPLLSRVYYMVDGTKQGPNTIDQIKVLLGKGIIKKETMVWIEGHWDKEKQPLLRPLDKCYRELGIPADFPQGKDKSWEIMNETEQKDARSLGWTQKSWDAGEGGRFLRHWGSMESTEKRAAINLGFKKTDFVVPEGMDSLIYYVILLQEKEAELEGEMSTFQGLFGTDMDRWGDEFLKEIQYLKKDISELKKYIHDLRSHFKKNGFADVDIDATVEAAVLIDAGNKSQQKAAAKSVQERKEAERKAAEEAEREEEEAEREEEEAERKAAEAERKAEEAERKAAEEVERKAAEEAERKAAEEADRKAEEAKRKVEEAKRKAEEAKRKVEEAGKKLGTSFPYKCKKTGQNTNATVIKYKINEKGPKFLISYKVALSDGGFEQRTTWTYELP
jgi:hypothetical protein